MNEGVDVVRNPPRAFISIAVACLLAAPIAHVVLDPDLARLARRHSLGQSQVLQWTTELGEGGYWLVPAGIVFAIAAVRRQHNLARWAFAMVAAVGGSGIVANLLKLLLGKARPKVLFEDGRFGFTPFSYGYDVNSMPSGHATTCGAAATILALAFPGARWPILAAGAFVASTRVLIQAHYLSDVLAGLALGIGCGLATFAVWRRFWPASVPRVGGLR